MNKVKEILWGVVFVALGILLGCYLFKLVDFNLFFKGWWTLFIIVPSAINMLTDEKKSGPFIGFLIGCLLYLQQRGVFKLEYIFKLIIPVSLIVYGLTCIFKNLFKKNNENDNDNDIENYKKEEAIKKNKVKINDKNSYTSVFSGNEICFDNQDFKGANLTAVFGGLDLNLKNAKIIDKSTINCFVLFGGIDIKTSDDVTVKVNSTSIFGGVNNKKVNNNDNVIYINATCIFGGIDIK